jgi:glucosamine--fructose-6-phosphate aminotransferase (isomerizing)
MIKMIEGAYIHAHALPAGDLKHYVITLMEENVPVVAAITNPLYKKDICNALSEVRARGAFTIGISADRDDLFDYWIKIPDLGELNCLVALVVIQLLAYYMALELGRSIDKPRNIAKSVTVL